MRSLQRGSSHQCREKSEKSSGTHDSERNRKECRWTESGTRVGLVLKGENFLVVEEKEERTRRSLACKETSRRVA